MFSAVFGGLARWIAFGMLLLACGARAEDGSLAEKAAERELDQESQQAMPLDPSGTAPGGSKGIFGSGVELPVCVLGTSRARASSCPYVVDERCYQEELMACACACTPRPVRPLCIGSIFLDGAGALPVTCTESP